MTSKIENLDEFQNEEIWMPKVIITQSPLVVSTLGKDVCPDEIKIPEINSWAQKYIESDDIYGIEITADSIHFFIPRITFFSTAYNKGEMLLHKLIQRFPGLDGYSAPCKTPSFPSKSDFVYELKSIDNNLHYSPISNPNGKINLVEKFLLSVIKEGLNIRLIILFEYFNGSNSKLKKNKSNLKVYFIGETPKFEFSKFYSHQNEKVNSFLYSVIEDPQIGNKNRLILRELYGNDLKKNWTGIWSSFTFEKKLN